MVVVRGQGRSRGERYRHLHLKEPAGRTEESLAGEESGRDGERGVESERGERERGPEGEGERER